MSDLLTRALDGIVVNEPLFASNLSIYPLTNGGGKSTGINTLDESLARGQVTINEYEIPRVEEIILDNQGDEPLFLLDGEEIFGAQQTRVTTTASIVEGRSLAPVPVACIEEGRWGGGSEFEGSFASTHPRLRSIICKGVNSSLESSKSFTAPQRLVWNEITRKLNSLKVNSATSSFHDLATSMDDKLERFSIDSKALSGTQGMIVASGNRILGLEYYQDSSLFFRLAPKLLKGYGLEGLEIRSSKSPPSLSRLEAEINKIKILEPSIYPGISSGSDYRFGNRSWVGRALVTDESVFQASFFPAVN